MKHPPQCQIDLKDNERIVAAIPETITGAGYHNFIIWVHIVDYSKQTWREECIQPEEQTPVMIALFKPLEQAHEVMLGEIETVKE
jgi:hypothetical protein